MLIIPAIDLKEGACVRLKRGNMEEATQFSQDPVRVAARWVNAGCRRLHLVDLNGAFAGEPVHAEVVRAICVEFPDLPIQIGGGIRTMATIESYIEAGVHYVILGTAAVKNPEFVQQACRGFSGHIIVGIDARDGKVATDGWATTSTIEATDLAAQCEHYGVSSIVYTDISRDGMMQGVNIDATQALAESVNIPVIASGGVSHMADIQALKPLEKSGVMGAITGRAIYEGTLDLRQAQQYLDD